MARRTWFVWHSWIGLTAGLLLFVICWSGTIAVFSRELDALANPEIAAPPSEEVAWSAVHDAVRCQRPELLITQINAPLRPGYAAEVWTEDKDGVLGRVYADPATGRVLGATSYFNAQRFFRSLHMSLFIGGWQIWGIPFGYLVVGLLSLPLLASLVTALVFYKRWWRRFFHLESRKGARVLWSDLHKLVGLWSLWFVALIGLTGIWYLVEWKAPEAVELEVAARTPSANPALSLDRLVADARRANRALEVKAVALYRLAEGIVEVQGQDGAALVRDRASKVYLDARDGTVLGIRSAADLPLYDRWIETADPLHFGTFGGLVTQALWFAFGLAMSGLCLTGAYLQAKRQAVRHESWRHRPAILASYAVSVAVLMAAAWHGFEEARSYAPGGTWPEAPAAALAIIIAWLVSTITVLTAWMRGLR